LAIRVNVVSPTDVIFLIEYVFLALCQKFFDKVDSKQTTGRFSQTTRQIASDCFEQLCHFKALEQQQYRHWYGLYRSLSNLQTELTLLPDHIFGTLTCSKALSSSPRSIVSGTERAWLQNVNLYEIPQFDFQQCKVYWGYDVQYIPTVAVIPCDACKQSI
jgi:hypothetical protein